MALAYLEPDWQFLFIVNISISTLFQVSVGTRYLFIYVFIYLFILFNEFISIRMVLSGVLFEFSFQKVLSSWVTAWFVFINWSVSTAVYKYILCLVSIRRVFLVLSYFDFLILIFNVSFFIIVFKELSSLTLLLRMRYLEVSLG